MTVAAEQPAEPEKEAEAEKLKCVYYDDQICPVRNAMNKGKTLDKYLKPFEKGSDEKQFLLKYTDAMKDLLDRFIGEFSTLYSFCLQCPIKWKKDPPEMRVKECQ
jgi:hypothetical protein